jgi:predicted AlkP superfamily phosphohydrolase/phosphomutase
MKANNVKRAIVVGLDGADPVITSALMKDGRLPNLQKIKEMGVTTKDMSMFGVHPTITPPNWASLATGAYPSTHGITCFWNHKSGDDLFKLSHGFNSELCKAEYIWDVAVREGKKCIVYNYPTGWPPTSKENMIVVDGTGINVNARALIDHERIYYCKAGDFEAEHIPYDADQSGTDCAAVSAESNTKNFNVAAGSPGGRNIRMLSDKKIDPTGQRKIDLAYSPIKQASGWKKETDNAKEVVLPVNGGKERRYGLIIAEDGKTYNKLEIYASKNDLLPLGVVKKDEWSEWVNDSFILEEGKVPVALKFKLLRLTDDGSELDLYYNAPMNLADDKWFYPSAIGKELLENVGPMVYQSYSQDDELMLEVMEQLYDFYARSLLYLANNKEWQLLYFHVHALDSANHTYQNKILKEYGEDHEKYQEILARYYEISDKFVERIMELLDEETTMFIVSDHGGMSKDEANEIPLLGDPWNVGGKVLEDLGYLVVDRSSDTVEVDWEKTKAIGQRSGYIYINLRGRDPYGSVSQEEYDELVEKIIDDLYCYKDENGKRPIGIALNREDMALLGLSGDTVGDVYFTYKPGWARVHGTSLTTNSNKGTSVKCLFMAAGAGIKEGETLNRRVNIVDIVPTICDLMNLPMPKDVEGGILYQALKK